MKHMVRCKTLKSLKKTKLLDVSFVCIRPKKEPSRADNHKRKKRNYNGPFCPRYYVICLWHSILCSSPSLHSSDDFPSFMGGSKFKEFSIYGVQSSTWNWDRWVSAIWLNCASKKKVAYVLLCLFKRGFFLAIFYLYLGPGRIQVTSFCRIVLPFSGSQWNTTCITKFSTYCQANFAHIYLVHLISIAFIWEREKHCLNRPIQY